MSASFDPSRARPPEDGTGTARLAGRVVVITGATGIAAAGAVRLAAEGAAVFIISIDADECRTLTGRIDAAGGRTGWATADLRDEDATTAAFALCRSEMGHIDGLFAVAGASGRHLGDGPVHDMSLAGWQGTFDLNGPPMFLATREAVRAMRDQGSGGSVVIVTSVLASRPVPDLFGTHAYAAVKGAAIALTTTMAATYAPDGIRVNAVAPSLVETPMSQRAAADPASVAYAAVKQPLAGGFLPPGAIADTAAFLLSDDARYITGQVIAVDGGWSVTEPRS